VIPPVRLACLQDWLAWQQTLHPKLIDPGLERIRRVLVRTGWQSPECPVITVGGTNGKGSVVALLDAMLRAAGRRVLTFTSPHLVDYRERIRLDGRCVSEASLLVAFERLAAALGPDTLTYFEFNALAALLVAESWQPDTLILEVGMGGRLDAVNVVDPDVAVIVSVGLDHMEWLGADLESIAREKAGILRGGRPAVFGGVEPPASLREEAARLGARLYWRGRDFAAVERDAKHWDYRGLRGGRIELPNPALAGEVQRANAATALAALECLADRLPLPDDVQLASALQGVRLAGRFQRLRVEPGPEWILDVAHNPDAARTLARNLAATPCTGRTLAVCGMLADKDVAAVVSELRGQVDGWYAAGTAGERALSDRDLVERVGEVGVVAQPAGSVTEAMQRVAREAGAQDRIVCFGSFHTVGPALAWLRERGITGA
jgi:dihydrofolate synthase/folylpolyglutamate synthase